MHDAHLHLQDPRLQADLESVVQSMREAGITRCVINGTSPRDWAQVQQLAERYSDLVIPSYGLHPWQSHEEFPGWESELLAYLGSHPLACLGECGLDRWIEHHNLPRQSEIFLAHLAIATERNLPLSIHCLKAWGQLIDLLENHPLPKRGIMLHSYGGSVELVPRLCKLNCYFSFSGYFLQPRKAKVIAAYRKVPVDRLLLESDAPDMLPPEPFVAHPADYNHPANLPKISEGLATQLKLPQEKLLKQLEDNFTEFFLNRENSPSF